MKVEILQEAEEELNQAIVRYKEIEVGLGIRLKEEARLAIRWIGNNPELPRLRPKGYRRVNLKVFRTMSHILSGPTRFGYWRWRTGIGGLNTGCRGRTTLLERRAVGGKERN